MPREIVYTGKKINLAIETITLTDGQTATREIVVHPGAAVMLPFVDEERICLVRNQRIAVGETLLELPAGTIDPGESPEQTAARELTEETGYHAEKLTKFAEIYPSPGILSERMFFFAAHGLTPGDQQLDPGEQLQPVVMNWSDAIRSALDGTIKDGKTIVGLLMWERLRSRSR